MPRAIANSRNRCAIPARAAHASVRLPGIGAPANNAASLRASVASNARRVRRARSASAARSRLAFAAINAIASMARHSCRSFSSRCCNRFACARSPRYRHANPTAAIRQMAMADMETGN